AVADRLALAARAVLARRHAELRRRLLVEPGHRAVARLEQRLGDPPPVLERRLHRLDPVGILVVARRDAHGPLERALQVERARPHRARELLERDPLAAALVQIAPGFVDDAFHGSHSSARPGAPAIRFLLRKGRKRGQNNFPQMSSYVRRHFRKIVLTPFSGLLFCSGHFRLSMTRLALPIERSMVVMGTMRTSVVTPMKLLMLCCRRRAESSSFMPGCSSTSTVRQSSGPSLESSST